MKPFHFQNFFLRLFFRNARKMEHKISSSLEKRKFYYKTYHIVDEIANVCHELLTRTPTVEEEELQSLQLQVLKF